MPEELLDDPEVGPALEEMRGERMPEPMGVAEEASNGARVEAASTDREEDGVVRSDGEGGSAALEVVRDVERGFLAEWDDALLAALASYVDELAVEVDVSEVE